MNEMHDCPIHKEMKISFRCNDHSVCICTACRVDTHRNCEHVFDITKREALERDLENVQENLEDLMLSAASLKNKREENRKVLYKSRAEILNDQEVIIQKAMNALEQLKEKLAKETNEQIQVALCDIDKDIESIELIEKSVKKNRGILEATKKYCDSVRPQVIEYLLADATENEKTLVRDLTKKKDHKLVFMRNKDCILVPSLGTVSLILDEEHEESGMKHECFELSIELTSDEVTECEARSLHAVSAPIDTPTRSLPTTSESFVIEKQEINISVDTDNYLSSIYGVSVLSNGGLVIIDNENSNIKLLSSDYTLLHVLRLPGNPIRICPIGKDKFAVSFGLLKRINRYSVVGNTILYDGGFPTTLFNHGIGFDGKSIVAIMCDEDFGCSNYAKNGTIQVEFRNPLDGKINGVIKDFKVVGNKSWSLALNCTQALQFTEDGYMIIAELNRLLCFSYREEFGKTVAIEKMFYVCQGEVPKEDIENIATDSDSVFVCTRSGCVLQLSSSDFKSNRIILSDTGKFFEAIAVDSTNGRLILGCIEKDEILVYEFKRKG